LRFAGRGIFPEYFPLYRLQVAAGVFRFDFVVLSLSQVTLEVGEFPGGFCQFFYNTIYTSQTRLSEIFELSEKTEAFKRRFLRYF